jgi:hypothetical protein
MPRAIYCSNQAKSTFALKHDNTSSQSQKVAAAPQRNTSYSPTRVTSHYQSCLKQNTGPACKAKAGLAHIFFFSSILLLLRPCQKNKIKKKGRVACASNSTL